MSTRQWIGLIALVQAAVFIFIGRLPPRGPLIMAFFPMYGQPKDQIEIDIRACQQQAQQASVYDPFVLPVHRNIEPQSLRVEVSCRTKIGYIMFLTYGQTLDQLEADRQACLTAAKTPSGYDVERIVGCMLGRGYFVAGPDFARSPK